MVMKKASVDDYIKNILNSSSLDNEMKLSFQRKKAANNQQTNEHTKPVPSTGKYAPQIPLWATNESYVPALFKNIRQRVTRENGHLDTNGIYTIFLSSGLPNTVLGLVWNCVNRTLPGELLPHELNLGLALLGVIQHQMRQGLCNNPQWSLPTIEQLCQLNDAPIPQLSLPASVAMSQQPVVSHSTTLSSSTTHVPPTASTPQLNASALSMATTSRADRMGQASHSPSVMSPPDMAPPSYETAVSMMKTGASALTPVTVNEDDDFGDFASSRVPVSANTSLAMPSVSSQSGSSPSLSNAPAVTQSDCDFFSAPPNPGNSSDWADFTSFQTATSSSTNQNPSTADVKAMPLSVKLPFNITAPAASKTTPTVNTTFSTEEVDLPLSVEKHETVDRYAVLRDELADFDHSSSGSDEITTSPSGCDPASICSSRSSTNNDIHWTNTQIHVNKSVDSDAPSFSKLDDEFTDFRGAIPQKFDGGSSTHHSQHQSQKPDEFGEFKQSDGPPVVVQQSPAAHLQSVPPGQSVSQSHGTSPTSNISALNSIISSISSNDREKKATNSSKFDLIDSIFKSVAKPNVTSADRNAVDDDGDEFGSFSSAKMESRVESVVEHQSGTVEQTFTSPSANRYDCILDDETICDAYEKEWLRCLERCHALLQEAEILLDEIIEKGLLNEVLDTKKGNSYIQGLTEVYSVSLRISQAQNAFDVVNNKLHETIGSIKSVWSSLIIKCPKLSVDLKELLGSIVPDKSMNEKELCGICLNSVSNSKLSPSVLIYGSRHYHCSCANFWVNCLDLTLPQLRKPHLI